MWLGRDMLQEASRVPTNPCHVEVLAESWPAVQGTMKRHWAKYHGEKSDEDAAANVCEQRRTRKGASLVHGAQHLSSEHSALVVSPFSWSIPGLGKEKTKRAGLALSVCYARDPLSLPHITGEGSEKKVGEWVQEHVVPPSAVVFC